MMTQVLCYGGICIDNIIHIPYLPTPGVATTPTHQQYLLGGGATITALWLANWQIPVALSGNAIGTDAYGQQIIDHLQQYPSCKTKWIQQIETVTTPYTRALVPPNGDRYLIEFGYDVAPMTPPEHLSLQDVDIMTVNYYYNNPEQASQQLARTAYENNITIIASDILAPDNPFFDVSHILINSCAVMQKVLLDSDPYNYSHSLQRQHGGVLILTDSDRPVYVINEDGSSFFVDVPTVSVYNATGAGDAFRAGFIYGKLTGLSLEACVKLAVASGMLQVQRTDETLPDLTTIKQQASQLAVRQNT